MKSFGLLIEALYLSGSYEQAMEIGAALCYEDPLFLNNGLLATALASDIHKGGELFADATKHMEQIPNYIRYNMSAFEKLREIGTTRMKNVLYFAAFPNTIVSGKSLRPKVKPLRVEVQLAGKHGTGHFYESGFISVGRSPGHDITITGDSNVSRFHGLFYYRDALYHYRDLKSTQGFFVDEKRIHHDIPLVGMEAIRIGGSLLKVSY